MQSRTGLPEGKIADRSFYARRGRAAVLRQAFRPKLLGMVSIAGLMLSTPVIAQSDVANTKDPYATQGKEDVEWRFPDFGQPQAPVGSSHDRDLGVTSLAFANRVRVVLLPRPDGERDVEIVLRYGEGLKSVDPQNTYVARYWHLGSPKSVMHLSIEDAQEMFLGRSFSIDPLRGQFKESYIESRVTVDKDLLPLQLKLLTSQFFEPRWDDPHFLPANAGARHRSLESARSALQGSPLLIAATEANVMLHSGDARLRNPTERMAETADTQVLQQVLERQITEGPIDLAIVGDFDAEAITRLLTETLGAIPRPSRSSVANPPLGRFPEPATQVRYHQGSSDRAVLFMSWPVPTFRIEPETSLALEMAGFIIERRLKRMGWSSGEPADFVGVSIEDTFAAEPGDSGVASVIAELDAADIDKFKTALIEVIEDISVSSISQDERNFAKRKMMMQQVLNALNKSVVADDLLSALDFPDLFSRYTERHESVNSMSSEFVSASVRKHMAPQDSRDLQIIPEPVVQGPVPN